MAKSKVKSEELREQLNALRQEQTELQARLEEIAAIQAAAADPNAKALDVGALKELVSEKAGIEGLLEIIAPRVHGLQQAYRQARNEENGAKALALRPTERMLHLAIMDHR